MVSSRLSHRWQAAVGTVDQSSRQITVWFWSKNSLESSNSAPMSLTSLTVSCADAISAKSTTNFPQQSSLISLKRLANCTKLSQWRLYTSCGNTSVNCACVAGVPSTRSVHRGQVWKIVVNYDKSRSWDTMGYYDNGRSWYRKGNYHNGRSWYKMG